LLIAAPDAGDLVFQRQLLSAFGKCAKLPFIAGGWQWILDKPISR